jgi:hypothetical protein
MIEYGDVARRHMTKRQIAVAGAIAHPRSTKPTPLQARARDRRTA